jgi:phage tail-like protein
MIVIPSWTYLRKLPAWRRVLRAVNASSLTLLVGGFTSIQGMGWKTEVETVREGGVNDRVHRLPGRTTCNELVLTKGMALLDPLWEWYSLTLSGNALPMNGLIYLTMDIHTPRGWGGYRPTAAPPQLGGIWHFTGAWPTALEGVQCDASQSLLAVQKMTLSIESIKKSVSLGSFL